MARWAGRYPSGTEPQIGAWTPERPLLYAEALTIAVSELSGDLEIFVTRPGTTDFWSDRSRGGTDRSVVIAGPEAGVYGIEVAAAYQGAESIFTVTVSG